MDKRTKRDIIMGTYGSALLVVGLLDDSLLYAVIGAGSILIAYL